MNTETKNIYDLFLKEIKDLIVYNGFENVACDDIEDFFNLPDELFGWIAPPETNLLCFYLNFLDEQLKKGRNEAIIMNTDETDFKFIYASVLSGIPYNSINNHFSVEINQYLSYILTTVKNKIENNFKHNKFFSFFINNIDVFQEQLQKHIIEQNMIGNQLYESFYFVN